MGKYQEQQFPVETVVTKPQIKTKKPKLYQVFLLNDDYTPMEFVIEILQAFFLFDRNKATRVMLEVHHKGKGICGVFTHDVAETKVVQVNEFARQNQFPLLCSMEAV